MRALLISAVLLSFFFGCAQTAQPSSAQGQPSYSAAQECVMACEASYRAGTDLSNGPCLGVIAGDYACDVAHSPRASADGLAENQCQEYAEGKAHHFVEVTPDCRLLRVS